MESHTYTIEKKRQVDEDTPPTERSRKKQLNDAFQSLSLQNPELWAHENATKSPKRTQLEHGPSSWHGRTPEVDDAEMRDPSSYAKDAHTIVINSLDDESDVEGDDEPRFVFNLPKIDTTFAGSKGIPECLLQSHQADTQLVLYKGSPEEIIGRSVADSRTDTTPTGNASDPNGRDRETASDAEEAMDLD